MDQSRSLPGDRTLGPPPRLYQRAVGPRLRRLLLPVFALFGLLLANAAYLGGVTFLGWLRGISYQNYFYLWMFLAHVGLGILLIPPFVLFAAGHLKNAYHRPNRRAVRAGFVLLAASIVLLASGIALLRIGPLTLRNPSLRSAAYWSHVAMPLAVIWLYVLHRLAGPRIKWGLAIRMSAAVGAVVAAMIFLNSRDPRRWNVAGPNEGIQYFQPSLARTATGSFIPARSLMLDRYCLECHKDAYGGWFHSAHHFSSFNNPFYLFSVRETRQVVLKRDGNVQAARWCAGCHDPVPFFSGAFDDVKFDDVNHPTAQAGITCISCHAITHINSTRGNADYRIEEPLLYPFSFAENPVLRFINRQLVKAKPDFHKRVFLKPLHRTAEFCSVCHKVSIPGELNHYKEFLRGQNHYDTFLLSGASGHGARSFYYPDRAKQNCAACHMPPRPSDNFGARPLDPGQPTVLLIHDHLFPGGNTALPALRGDIQTVKAQQDFLKDVVRVDLFAIKEGGRIDAIPQVIRPNLPPLKPGNDYFLEVVIRTLTLGHPLTQGTADSNEIWLQVEARDGEQVIARNGDIRADGTVDPWADFLNVYMLDRNGHRIDRRNVQDIFTPLYDHQVPPGAARVAHYRLHVPENQSAPITVTVRLQYRKFDATYYRYVFGDGAINALPITTLADDAVTFPISPKTAIRAITSPIPRWQRWNDYGIGLLLEGDSAADRGELRQAAEAFAEVERLGRADGPLNLARVYLKEGSTDEAADALARAAKLDPPPPRWTLEWLSGLVEEQNGELDRAILDFRAIVEDRYDELERRGLDFSKDYVVLNALGMALFERSKAQKPASAEQRALLHDAAGRFEQTLAIDSENLTAHYVLAMIYQSLGDAARSAAHRAAHEHLRPDDNASDRAVKLARSRDPAADHAARSPAIYDLQSDRRN